MLFQCHFNYFIAIDYHRLTYISRKKTIFQKIKKRNTTYAIYQPHKSKLNDRVNTHLHAPDIFTTLKNVCLCTLNSNKKERYVCYVSSIYLQEFISFPYFTFNHCIIFDSYATTTNIRNYAPCFTIVLFHIIQIPNQFGWYNKNNHVQEQK